MWIFVDDYRKKSILSFQFCLTFGTIWSLDNCRCSATQWVTPFIVFVPRFPRFWVRICGTCARLCRNIKPRSQIFMHEKAVSSSKFIPTLVQNAWNLFHHYSTSMYIALDTYHHTTIMIIYSPLVLVEMFGDDNDDEDILPIVAAVVGVIYHNSLRRRTRLTRYANA